MIFRVSEWSGPSTRWRLARACLYLQNATVLPLDAIRVARIRATSSIVAFSDSDSKKYFFSLGGANLNASAAATAVDSRASMAPIAMNIHGFRIHADGLTCPK